MTIQIELWHLLVACLVVWGVPTVLLWWYWHNFESRGSASASIGTFVCWLAWSLFWALFALALTLFWWGRS